MMLKLAKLGLAFVVIVVLLALAAAGFVAIQGRRTPIGPPYYVALGSSFAAGPALGALQPNSPLLCARTTNNYPQQLARRLKLPVVDMSCGGAVTTHLLHGGQFFQGAQIRVIDPTTRLVTITVGGNDLGYVGDLSMLAARHSRTLLGWSITQGWRGPRPADRRDYLGFEGNLVALIDSIRARAPGVTIVVATYPAILPPSGTCGRLHLTTPEANLMRDVERHFIAATRLAAHRGGAVLVDMHALGAAHHACSAKPWTRGWTSLNEAPFHPTLAGASATAEAIAEALPAAISAVGQHDAAGHQAGRVGSQEQDH